jgi:hypothetical protein
MKNVIIIEGGIPTFAKNSKHVMLDTTTMIRIKAPYIIFLKVFRFFILRFTLT